MGCERLDRGAQMTLVVPPASDRGRIHGLVDLVMGWRHDVAPGEMKIQAARIGVEPEEMQQVFGDFFLLIHEILVPHLVKGNGEDGTEMIHQAIMLLAGNDEIVEIARPGERIPPEGM